MCALGSLGEMLADMESGVMDFTVDGKCSNCGQCCSNILPISQKEIKNIRRYIAKHGIEEQICRYPTSVAPMDLTCPFRDDSHKKCLIYEVRPAICRDFQCDKPRKKIYADKAMYHGKYDPVDMRAEFYGRKSVLESWMEELVRG